MKDSNYPRPNPVTVTNADSIRDRKLDHLALAILVGVICTFIWMMFPWSGSYRPKKTEITRTAEAELAKVLQRYRQHYGRYPSTSEGLDALLYTAEGKVTWKNHQIPPDPWGNPYVYVSPTPGSPNSFQIISYGQDGRLGGFGDNADIVVQE